MEPNERAEWLRCAESAPYFIDRYCLVYDATSRDWLPFALWPAQFRVLRTLTRERLVIMLKSRQLGMTWLVLAYALWLMLFHPIATILLFSRRDDEAVNMLAFRLVGMYDRLPDWMKARGVVENNDHNFTLSNGSMAKAFPPNGGDSYTATLAIVDEADLLPDLGALLGAVKPTVDAGGQMILLSRVDKEKPQSEFKNIYRAAKEKLNGWAGIFLGWFERPGRTRAWYEDKKREIQSRTGSLDELHEHYPETDVEALAANSVGKRIIGDWLTKCFVRSAPIAAPSAPAIPELVIYRLPELGRRYVAGADPAEGNPTSDESAATWQDAETGEEVAALAGLFEPATFGAHIDAVSMFFNKAGALVERNNHGHAVLLWLRDHSKINRLLGHDGKEGWLSNSKGKALLYDRAAEDLRDAETTVHSFATFNQLASIVGSTLRAPEGEKDDRADSYALACVARTIKTPEVRVRTL